MQQLRGSSVIPNGSGRILSIVGTWYAKYRAEAGALKFNSAK
jgi:hypothetical protein